MVAPRRGGGQRGSGPRRRRSEALDGSKRVGEHRWRPRKLATGSFGREEGWRRELRGEQTTTAVMAGGGRPLGQGARLGALLGARRGRGRRKCEHPTRGEGSGRFQGETRVRRSRTGRHGVAVAVSAAILVERAGDDDAWRGPAASGESRTGKGWGAVRERPMADGLGVRPTQNREGEREERERFEWFQI